MTTRLNWFDGDTELPALAEHVQQLEHFTNSLADGIIDKDELAQQNENVVAAMKAVEDDLSDKQHAKVTKLLLELMALTVMSTIHEMAPPQAPVAVEA